jgi:hypothetical protein
MSSPTAATCFMNLTSVLAEYYRFSPGRVHTISSLQ